MRTESVMLLPSRSTSIRIHLTVPVTRIAFGALSFDPLEKLLGMPLGAILEPLTVGPVQRRPSTSGPAVEIYPLALPDGDGATLHLGSFGELSFANAGGLLVLRVPLPAGAWVSQRLGNAIVGRPVETLSSDGTSRVAEFRVRLQPGMRMALPLGVLGELGLEAG